MDIWTKFEFLCPLKSLMKRGQGQSAERCITVPIVWLCVIFRGFVVVVVFVVDFRGHSIFFFFSFLPLLLMSYPFVN